MLKATVRKKFYSNGDTSINGEWLQKLRLCSAHGLWAVRVHHGNPAVARELGFCRLIRRTVTSLNRINDHLCTITSFNQNLTEALVKMWPKGPLIRLKRFFYYKINIHNLMIYIWYGWVMLRMKKSIVRECYIPRRGQQ